MAEFPTAGNGRLKKELLLFAALAGTGVLLLPLAIFLVGKAVFGSYGGGDAFDFYADLYRRLGGLEPTAWFLLLAPYLLWQGLRLALLALRGRRAGGAA